MFRAAFPGCSEELEKIETRYVKVNYDSPGANGGPGKENLRLAGLWVLPEVATMLAPMYNLESPIRSLVQANPDPNSEYRRSTKTASPTKENTAPAAAPVATTSTAPPSVTVPDTPKPTKRRKESSPSPKKVVEELPTPRRSERFQSPPAPNPRSTRTRATKTTTTKVAVKFNDERATGMLTPAEEEEEEEVADVPGPHMEQDIEEQQALIAKLKADRAAQEASSSTGPSDSQAAKRSREDSKEQLKFQFREPADATALTKREIKTNKRLSLDLEPQQKSAAWGALWFAAGLAAA